MKTIVCKLFFLFVLSFFYLNEAKTQSFSPGDLVLNASLGTGSGTNLFLTGDYGIADNLSVGGGLYYFHFSVFGIGVSSTSLLGRVLYHFSDAINLNVDNLDLYGGGELALGLSSGGGLGFNILPGARYYFSDNWAAHLELPINLSGGGTFLRIGASYRLSR
ncbi:MAG TPA: hypothetical protein PKC30_10035 [Saprospiraceae bacterium]|nr:hypothetical protein [Saprospiraceae bacterium]